MNSNSGVSGTDNELTILLILFKIFGEATSLQPKTRGFYKDTIVENITRKFFNIIALTKNNNNIIQ